MKWVSKILFLIVVFFPFFGFSKVSPTASMHDVDALTISEALAEIEADGAQVAQVAVISVDGFRTSEQACMDLCESRNKIFAGAFPTSNRVKCDKMYSSSGKVCDEFRCECMVVY